MAILRWPLIEDVLHSVDPLFHVCGVRAVWKISAGKYS